MLRRDDDFEMDAEVESKSAGYAGDLSNMAQRQRALEQQKERARQKMQQRRGQSGAVQTNRAFTGASRSISSNRTRNFSAPKTIDPLEGEDDLDERPVVKRTGYADSFRGSGRNVSGAYGGVYESLHARVPESNSHHEPAFDPRVANVQSHSNNGAQREQQRFSHPNAVEDETKDESPPARVHTVESKVEQDLLKRGLQASYDPTPDPEPVARKSSSSSKTRSSTSSSSSKSTRSKPTSSSSRPRSSSKSKSTSSRSKQLSVDEEAGLEDEEAEFEQQQAVEERRPAAAPRRRAAADEEEESADEEEEAETTSRASRPSKKATSAKTLQRQEADKSRSSRKQSAREPESKQAEPSLARRSFNNEDDEEDVSEDVAEAQRSRSNSRAKKAPAARKHIALNEEEEEEDEDAGRKSSEDEYEAVERPIGKAGSSSSAHKFDFTDMRAFLMNAVPKSAGTVQCYIERSKAGSSRLFPEYHLFLKEGDRFLMAAKKRAKNRTSNYSISMDPKDLNKGSGNFIGKLRANFIGTEFQIFDHGVNPKHADPDSLHVGATPVREELGCVLYASNVLGSRGPRKMKVAIPKVSSEGKRVQVRPTRKADELVTRFKDRDMNDLVELVNKPPRWNDHVSAFVLNFNGRVTMASVKNFQLISPEDEDTIVLQFGRVGKDLFTADLAWPLSPLQAFAICLSSFDSKLACE